jgi:NTP pyrophosphatase (non-canonical NTP hydrolase)
MTADSAHLIHMIMGLCGETGELLDAIKKSVIYNKTLDIENVIEELGDIEFYLEGLRQSLGITRDETLSENISKLTVRYADLSYTDKAAQERADKA